jgi:hypothetical protein
MFAETQEQQLQRRMAEEFGRQLGGQASAFISDMANGLPPSIEGMQAVINGFSVYADRMPPELRASVGEQVRAMEFISGLANTLNQVGDPVYVRNLANQLASGGIEGEGVGGVDTELERSVRNFLLGYADRMERTVAEDPISWARNTGAVDIGPVNISASALSAGESGIGQRVLDARAVAARYGQNVRSIFGSQDAAQLVSQIDPNNFELALGQVQILKAQLGEYSDIGIRELQAAGLPPELVEAMYVDNPLVQRELVELVGVDTAALKVNVEFPRDISTELNTLMRDYFAAFEAGGGGAAIQAAAQQFAVAERLGLARARGSSESAAQIARGVVRDLLPPRENWVTSNTQLYIAPRNTNVNDVQLAADRMMSESQIRQAGIVALDNPLFPDYVDEEVSIAALSSRGIWLNNSTGDGIVLHYQFGDGQYLPATTADGSPYQLLFEDAAFVAQQQVDERTRRLEDAALGMPSEREQ